MTNHSEGKPDSLAERLRATSYLRHRGPDYEPLPVPPSAIALEAAARIDELEAALSARAPEAEPVAELVPSKRLEQLIGTGFANGAETHDMAVELLLHRRATPQPPTKALAVTEAMVERVAVAIDKADDATFERDPIARRTAIARAALEASAAPEPKCSVKTMQTSAGADHYVSIEVGGREITPHMFRDKAKAEYETDEWKWLFGQGPKPEFRNYKFSDDEVEAAPEPASPGGTVAVGWAYQDKKWDKNHWHLCADKPRGHEGREVREVYLGCTPPADTAALDALRRFDKAAVAWGLERNSSTPQHSSNKSALKEYTDAKATLEAALSSQPPAPTPEGEAK